MKKFKPFFIPLLCFILTDQMIKLIISSSYMEYDFDMIGNFIRFKPVLNTNLSWGGNYIAILSNPFIIILINICVLFGFISGYLFYLQKRTKPSRLIKLIVILGLAGSLCSLIDKLFWGGSLDFIQITNLFTFDLKDCYLH